MSDERIKSSGKEVLMDGRHLADAVDEGAAEAIALALTFAGLPSSRIPNRAQRRLEEFLS